MLLLIYLRFTLNYIQHTCQNRYKLYNTLKIRRIKKYHKIRAKVWSVEKVWKVWKNSTPHCGIPYCFILL